MRGLYNRPVARCSILQQSSVRDIPDGNSAHTLQLLPFISHLPRNISYGNKQSGTNRNTLEPRSRAMSDARHPGAASDFTTGTMFSLVVIGVGLICLCVPRRQVSGPIPRVLAPSRQIGCLLESPESRAPSSCLFLYVNRHYTPVAACVA